MENIGLIIPSCKGSDDVVTNKSVAVLTRIHVWILLQNVENMAAALVADGLSRAVILRPAGVYRLISLSGVSARDPNILSGQLSHLQPSLKFSVGHVDQLVELSVDRVLVLVVGG